MALPVRPGRDRTWGGPRTSAGRHQDRRELIETLKEVALATSEDSTVVRVDLTPRRIRLLAKSPEFGESAAKLPRVRAHTGNGGGRAALLC